MLYFVTLSVHLCQGRGEAGAEFLGRAAHEADRGEAQGARRAEDGEGRPEARCPGAEGAGPGGDAPACGHPRGAGRRGCPGSRVHSSCDMYVRGGRGQRAMVIIAISKSDMAF